MFFVSHCKVESGKRDGKLIARLSGNCINCGQQHTVDVDLPLYLAAKYGSRVGALQSLPYADREFMIVGRCPVCGVSKESVASPSPPIAEVTALAVQVAATTQAEKLPQADPQPEGRLDKAFITNACSKSVAFYVIQYLNNQGYTDDEIAAIRKQLRTERSSGRFNIKEIQRCIVTESEYFLKLFTEQFRVGFRTFLRSLEEGQRFAEVFPNDKSVAELISRLENRQIYHCNFECEWMRKDYEDDSKQLPNSGVFAESEVKKDRYLVRRDYLDKLGMRACTVCLGNEEVIVPF